MESQPVLAGLSLSAIFLVAVVEPGGEEQVRGTLTDVSGLVRSVGFREPDDGLSAVVGIGSAL
jgi:porphyrinogen peroxidase